MLPSGRRAFRPRPPVICLPKRTFLTGILVYALPGEKILGKAVERLPAANHGIQLAVPGRHLLQKRIDRFLRKLYLCLIAFVHRTAASPSVASRPAVMLFRTVSRNPHFVYRSAQ